MQRMLRFRLSTYLVLGGAAAFMTGGVVLVPGCFVDECDQGACAPLADGLAPASTTTSSVGGGGGASATGGGGGAPACTGDDECTSAEAARCDLTTNQCMPCTSSTQCEGVAGAEVCVTAANDDDRGLCVGCLDSADCAPNQTCDLLERTCVSVMPGTVGTCGACTNDDQCMGSHGCIPMDFPTGTLFGHYCIQDGAKLPCNANPFRDAKTATSLNGVTSDQYCTIDENSTTCEAVNALRNNWTCSGVNGMCRPEGASDDVPVPGAICRDFNANNLNRCTYACGGAIDCPEAGLASNCGLSPNNFCGGG